jgi:hypothetical protein
VQPTSLKPLSNGALIFSFNNIMGELDPSMKVSNADYVDKIPCYLRTLQYPSVISKSSYVAGKRKLQIVIFLNLFLIYKLKNEYIIIINLVLVGSGHAGVQLIAMLAWLLDAVEALQKSDPENVLFPHVETNEEEKLNKVKKKNQNKIFSNNTNKLVCCIKNRAVY